MVLDDKYRLDRLIGRGGMGHVWRCTHTHMVGEVAVKILIDRLRRKQSAIDRFWQEARLMGALGHPNIVKIFDVSPSTAPVPYMAMELLEQDSLRARLKREKTIEPDEAPEVELLPLAAADRAPSELDSVDITFRARDDFGIARAHLVIAADGGEGEETRLDLGAPPDQARAWNHRYAWDLSQMPIEERRALEYWIEVRDNDPARIGADPLPGKVTRSTRMRLEIHDRESEHAANIEGLRELRDAAVDHLAHRLLAAAFAAEPPALLAALDEARSLHAEIGDLLAGLATMIDQLSVDPLTRERDVANLTAIHRRLRAIYLDEAAAHAKMPPGAELGAGGRARTLLASLAAISERLVRQLEDEIIRLDDLVDNQIVDRIEALVARVEASQRKLVELLERLRAGDRTVEPAIEELQQRLREDLRRIAEARAQLHKEVDSEFLNLDAFRALESRLSHEDVMESLRRGDVDGALERARERLEELRGLRDSVQERLANAPSEQLSPQERARLVLLRELSRLQDTERGIEGESRTIHERWRAQVSQQALDDADATALKKRAEGLRESIESINDARLDREARRALDDAAEHLDRLSKTGNALEAQEGAEGLVDALERALAGAREGEREAKQLRRLVADAKEARERTRGRVPTPEATHQGESAAALEELAQRQGNARQRARELLALPEAEHLPEAGEAALERAAKSLDRSAGDLDRRASGEALGGEREALGWIQQAIDSLRKTSPPPSGASAQASTESERDRSLRDSVLEAMRERPPEGYDEPVKRYYEELLR
ncbi:MAG: protein kinase [Myxococcales bacterium]|nr:protein kinase [Myxococcales bacterium]